MSLIDNLSAYWKLDEASGSRVDSIKANTLTDNNTVTQGVGKVSSAAQFTRANSEYLSLTDNADMSTGDIDFTLSGWVSMDSGPAESIIVSKENPFGGSPDTAEYRFETTGNTGWAFYVFDSSHVVVGFTSITQSLFFGIWYFFVIWHDSVGNTVNIQINNGPIASAATTGSPSDTAAVFYIGARGAVNDPWDGRIDEVGFWKKVLTVDERTALWNNGQGLAFPFLPVSSIYVPNFPKMVMQTGAHL